MKPRIFVGSSVEGLNVAYAIQQNLAHDAETTVWDQGVFELSRTTIESLSNILDSVDFGIFVFSPDDVTVMREKKSLSIRDNVLFEFGLFFGKLSRDRVFFVIPEKIDFHIPTDLLGVTPGKYDPNREDKSFQAATGPACNQIRIQIKRLGILNTAKETQASDTPEESPNASPNEWLIDFFDKNYESAKVKLEKTKVEKSGDDLLRDEVWLAYINFKIDEKSGLKELLELAIKHTDKLVVQSLVPKMLLLEDNTDKAIELITKALQIHSSDNSLIILLSECYEKNGNISEAIDLLSCNSPSDNSEIAVALSEIYEKNEDLKSAIAVIHSAYINFPSNESVLYKYARLLIDCKRNNEALYLLNLLRNSYPQKVDYWGYFSNCCLELGLDNNAMVACKKAEELSKGKEAWVLHNIGNMLSNKRLYTEAIQWLQKGLELDSSSEYAHDRLAKAVKNKQGEDEKLENLCKEGRKLIRAYSVDKLAKPDN
jgi:tetratricopeptide (TPR) repeat protein